ncbi:MAG TPA: zinc ABC transporter substrate-binding protein [Nocardioidaceae bacterium]|nr:zinc ABC transporter substrate-binding protein [Nocardioidaceae bacterium]
MGRGWVLSLAACAAVLVSGCSSAADDAGSDAAISVVASTSVYASIAAAVGGQYVDTTAFIASAGQDPHSYEASGRDILAVSKADLVIENGGGYDDFMTQLIDSAGGDRRVIDVVDSSGIAGRDASGFNEHVWYNLAAMQETADQIAAALADIDPAHRDTFVANATNFDGQVQHLIDRAGRLRARLQGAPVAVTEPVPDYLLDSLGLDDITPEAFTKAVEEGDDIAVSTLAETLDLAKDHTIDALVYNAQTTGLISDQFLDAARDADIPVVAVSETLSEGTDYVSWMSDNLTRIAGALEQ